VRLHVQVGNSGGDSLIDMTRGGGMGIDINIRVSGGAGQGVHTVGNLIVRMVVGAGCHFHVTQDYMSRIRGGRNSQAIRIGSDPVRAAREEADILLAINPDHLPHFLPGVAKGGFAIADVPTAAPPLIAAPLKEMAAMAGSPILANVAGAGAIAHALGIPPETADPVFAADFKGDFFEKNRAVFRLGAEWAREHLPEEIGKRFRLPARLPVPRIILSGNEALALGALAGGCKFASGYPMTPGTSILAVLADEGPSLGLVFEQAEDEIAALNMAIGASYAGARSLVSTSGGGFALMTEAVSLAGMMETPVVVVLAMRPGPATGMPTRTEQGDLEFVLSAGHGEFPRLVLAPGSPEEAFASISPTRSWISNPTCWASCPSGGTSSAEIPSPARRRGDTSGTPTRKAGSPRWQCRGSKESPLWSTATSTPRTGTSPRTTKPVSGWLRRGSARGRSWPAGSFRLSSRGLRTGMRFLSDSARPRR
jgi:Pyruvate/2-oxoacid:ferredoxin oxidoreductase gamma subunit